MTYKGTFVRASGLVVAGLVIFATGAVIPKLWAQDTLISACVNPKSGEVKIGQACQPNEVSVTWNQTGPQGPAGPEGPEGPEGPAGPSGVANVTYVSGGMYPGTSVARAFCPAGTKVTGGGGLSFSGVGLRHSFAIADLTGLLAYGSNAIAWQVAASDFSAVQAFVVCVGP